MTLNASGPISLGGSTLGQSIALELIKDPTAQISMNDSKVRTLSGIGSGTQIMPTDFWGKTALNYWISALYAGETITGGKISNFIAADSVVDSSNNLYVIGRIDASQYSASYDSIVLIKYDSNGNLIWQKELGYGNRVASSISIDSSNNIYYTWYYNSSGFLLPILSKLNTDGQIQWTRRIDDTVNNTYNILFDSVVSDSSGVYVSGYTFGSSFTNEQIFIAKYNTNGVIQWQRRLGSSSANLLPYHMAIDSFSNLYISSLTDNGGSTHQAFIAKYNSSGTIQWQRRFSFSSVDVIAQSIAVDSSGNSYSLCSRNDGLSYNISILKLNSAGSIVWQRLLSGDDLRLGYGITLNKSNTAVYITCGSLAGSFPPRGISYICKYNTNGVIQWQRKLGTDGVGDDSREVGRAIVTNSSNDILFFGDLYDVVSPGSNTLAFITTKMPEDGSLTGTYTLSIPYSYSVEYKTTTSPSNSATNNLSSATPTYSNVVPVGANTVQSFSITDSTYSINRVALNP